MYLISLNVNLFEHLISSTFNFVTDLKYLCDFPVKFFLFITKNFL